MGKRVAVIEFMHETNTFNVFPTDMSSFREGHYFVGDEIENQFRGTGSEVSGFLQAADEFDWEPVFTVAALAEPGGIVSEVARKEITDEAISRLRKAEPCDGIYIALHGAMVTETSQAAETQFLKLIREVVGDVIPIAVTLDLHANIFDEMAKYANIAVSYRTYPHIDMVERAKEACDLLEKAMNGEIAPALEITRPPMLVGCNDGKTTDGGPMCQLLASAARKTEQEGILCISINAGFTDADVKASGPSVLVCFDKANTVEGLPKQLGQKICDEIWEFRDDYELPVPLAECLTLFDSQTTENGPIVIADFSDNPGSGAYGDCTAIIKGLLEGGVKNAAAGALWDAEAATKLSNYGLGKEVTLAIGGKTDPSVGGDPITVTGTITAISDGNFFYEGPMYQGLPGQLGTCVCLKVDGLEILIVSDRIQLLDKNIFRTVGIEPADKDVVVVKSMQHFRAAFAPIASSIIVTDAGGLCSPNILNRSYKNLRRPIHPFDSEEKCLHRNIENTNQPAAADLQNRGENESVEKMEKRDDAF